MKRVLHKLVKETYSDLSDSQGSTNTYAQALQYARTHPKRDGGSWNQWCASLMVRAGNLPDRSVRESAIIAYRASTIVSRDVNAAPPGAFHWWDIGQYGHVAMATDRGWALMASRNVRESWGDAIGVTPVDDYTSRTGARYLGWSYDYVGSEIADVRRPAPRPPGPTPPSGPVPHTSTAVDGVPGNIYYRRLQLFASKNGYTGPLDGQMGKNSWAGVQRGLRQFGYTGPDDGAPGANTYKAMQVAAQRFGYSGPIDGSMGANSYRGFAKFLNTL